MRNRVSPASPCCPASLVMVANAHQSSSPQVPQPEMQIMSSKQTKSGAKKRKNIMIFFHIVTLHIKIRIKRRTSCKVQFVKSSKFLIGTDSDSVQKLGRTPYSKTMYI